MGIFSKSIQMAGLIMILAMSSASAFSPDTIRYFVQETPYQLPQYHQHFQKFLNQGVPERALIRSLDYFYQINKRSFLVPARSGQKHWVYVGNDRFIIIVDYSKASTEKRLYVLNLLDGNVEKYYVAHGLNSGGNKLYRTSNLNGSLQSSLGFYLTGSEYYGLNGRSLKLYGLEKSNDLSFARDIVIHGASYVSPEFIRKYGRIGRSHGCLTLEKNVALDLIPRMKTGTLIYAYHQTLADLALQNPTYQGIADRNPKKDNPPPTRNELEQTP